jgi:hypothetical protein
MEFFACHADRAHEAYRRAFELLRGQHREFEQLHVASLVAVSAGFADMRIEQHRRLHADLRAELERHAGPLTLAYFDALGAPIEYLAGSLSAEEVRRTLVRHAELLEQTGSMHAATASLGFLPRLAWMEGDRAEYEARLRSDVQRFEQMSEARVLVNATANWALALSQTGQHARALEEVTTARGLGRADDVADQVALDVAEAHARAMLGQHLRAAELIQRARDRMDGLVMRPISEFIAAVDAEVRAARGDVAEAHEIARALADDFEARGLARIAEFYRSRFLQMLPPQTVTSPE